MMMRQHFFPKNAIFARETIVLARPYPPHWKDPKGGVSIGLTSILLT